MWGDSEPASKNTSRDQEQFAIQNPVTHHNMTALKGKPVHLKDLSKGRPQRGFVKSGRGGGFGGNADVRKIFGSFHKIRYIYHVSESWLKSYITDAQIHTKDHFPIRSDRSITLHS